MYIKMFPLTDGEVIYTHSSFLSMYGVDVNSKQRPLQ